MTCGAPGISLGLVGFRVAACCCPELASADSGLLVQPRGAAGPATGSTPVLANMAQSLHEHSCHALIEAWLLAGDGLADESYGREDFPGRDVLARVPARYRPGQERAERRLELVEETLREAIVGGVTGVQRGGEPALGGDEFREALGPPQERVPRTQCGPECRGSVDALVDLVLHYGDDEVGPAREMPVQRADAHSRTIGDLLRGRVHAAVREHGLGGLH